MLDEIGGSQSMRALYRCRQCGKTYRWKKTLQRHIKLECGGKAPQFPCPVCRYRFKYRSHRIRHMTKVHHVTHDEAQAVIDSMKDGGDPELDYEGVDVDVDVDVDIDDQEEYVTIDDLSSSNSSASFGRPPGSQGSQSSQGRRPSRPNSTPGSDDC